ncbi:hypothetical protein BJV74DRAFT_884322 [Russula compacta]|nr:hypothetical protein BJV74DRAFT_884322 [Russula compacta]
MPPISLALPRPILKHSPQPHPDLPDDTSLSLPIPRQCRNTVHFPPSPTLTRTFSAHSPSTYDRSPIVVLPNTCALPARGCPGRTYILGCTKSSSLDVNAIKGAIKAGGKHVHPRRALDLGLVPASTPDKSDESDGSASSPPQCDVKAAVFNPLTLLPFSSLPSLINIGEGLFHSPESPNEEDYRYHKYEEEKRRRRKHERDRGKGHRDRCPWQRAHGRDMSARDLERKSINASLEKN